LSYVFELILTAYFPCLVLLDWNNHGQG
jgi:hypothetical protein